MALPQPTQDNMARSILSFSTMVKNTGSADTPAISFIKTFTAAALLIKGAKAIPAVSLPPVLPIRNHDHFTPEELKERDRQHKTMVIVLATLISLGILGLGWFVWWFFNTGKNSRRERLDGVFERWGIRGWGRRE